MMQIIQKFFKPLPTMEVNQKENELHLYSINENEHIGAINSTVSGTDTYRTIVVLDSSLAVAARFVKEILPLVISKVKNWHSSVRLITFGDESVEKYLSKTELGNFNLKCGGDGGATNLTPAIEKLRLFLESSSTNARDLFDLLTISAGEISDRENAEREAKKLTDFLAKRGWRINSQAVRLFTGSNKPDTKALSYLLQLNNSTAANISDVDVSTSSNETVANEIAALFPENDFRYRILNVDKSINLRYPWMSFQWHLFIMTKGWNIFWLKQLPTADVVKLQDGSVNVVVEGQLNLAKFQQLMAKKLPDIISHMTILKIVGTVEANETVDQIFSYFASTEDAIAVKCSTPNNKIITNVLAEIAKYKPDFSDSEEMIEFHRNPIKAMEDRTEKERLKREEEERFMREEEERLEREENERLKREEEERLKQEEEERMKQEEEERLKQEEERMKRAELDPLKGAETEQAPLVLEEEMNGVGKSVSNVIIQTVFIIYEQQSKASISRRFTEEIVPMMLSKFFHESHQVVQLVTILRHRTATAQTIQSLVQTLDATKRIRISVVANGDDVEQQEIENFAETVIDLLSQSGYSFELQVVRLASGNVNKCKLVDIETTHEIFANPIA
ncbi:reticulocyte binding protein 2 homolog b-like [Bradysia coprophila]|uniref:reticulocyte binding protein 2 homolog b-like n=1 Tax=Bradysia coprophila TaxID=38358 RepID=UPI00187DAE46|nr:reticulocyte binding protein 2 homolog b-like [Bradysia coprophila]